MKILVDMNLSPQWVAYLSSFGFDAKHWSEIGPANAPDRHVMGWAASNGFTVLTHDLDFGDILAATNADGPSVIQLRVQDVMPSSAGLIVANAVRSNEAVLQAGALITIDAAKARLRILPLRRV